MPVQLGDHVRFRAGMTPEANKARERDVGGVVALLSETGPEPWPVVQFDGYGSVALQPGLVEVVGEPEAVRQEG